MVMLIMMTVMMVSVMNGTACSSLAFANCIKCTDADPVTLKGKCLACDSDHALKDDNSTCLGTYAQLFIVTFKNHVTSSSTSLKVYIAVLYAVGVAVCSMC